MCQNEEDAGIESGNTIESICPLIIFKLGRGEKNNQKPVFASLSLKYNLRSIQEILFVLYILL